MANVTDFTPAWAYVPAAYDRANVMPQIPVGLVNLSNSRSSTNFRLRYDGAYREMSNNDLINHYPLKNGKLHPNPVLFLEQKTTNDVPRSTDFNSWTANNVSVQNNQLNNPEKLQNADVLVSNNVAGTHSVSIVSATTLGSGPAVVSCFVHCGDREHVRLEIVRGATTYFQFFNIKTNVLGDKQGVDSAGIIDYPDGWKRVFMIITTTGTVSTTFKLLVADGNSIGDESFTGNNNADIWAWGYQYERNARVKPSSFIKTAAAAGDRVRDLCQFAGPVSLFNSQEGIFYIDVTWSKMSENPASIGLCDGTQNNGIFFARQTAAADTINSFVKVGGANVSFKAINTFNVGNRLRLAIAWQKNQFIHVVNGQQVHFDATGATFTIKQLNRVVLSNGNNANVFDGFVHEIRVYNPTHLSTGNLQAFLRTITRK